MTRDTLVCGIACCFPELQAMLQAATLELHVMASFLNNSSSRWEAICESWGVKAELVDNVSPIYRSDQQR